MGQNSAKNNQKNFDFFACFQNFRGGSGALPGGPRGPRGPTKFKKNHENSGYEEPVYSFLKAIGISEIIKLPNNFSIFWQDNFILASLWGHSIHRLKFDKDYNKLIFNEKIYLGKRIRDLIYLEDKKLILLALEEKGELGILRNTAQ